MRRRMLRGGHDRCSATVRRSASGTAVHCRTRQPVAVGSRLAAQFLINGSHFTAPQRRTRRDAAAVWKAELNLPCVLQRIVEIYTRLRKGKGKAKEIYMRLYCSTLTALKYGSQSFTCKLHHICLYLVSVHQTAPPLIVVADI